MMKVFVFLFAIALALYTEKTLLPLCKNSGMKFAMRWAYVNSVLIALIPFSSIFQYLQTIYVLLSVFVFWEIANKQFQLAELEQEKHQRAEELKRQQAEDAEIAWEKEKQRRALSKDCPMGFACNQMGWAGDSCINRQTCNALMERSTIPLPAIHEHTIAEHTIAEHTIAAVSN